MKILTYSLLYSCLLLLLGCSATGTDTCQWTQFRGSDGLGIDAVGTAPVTWGTTDYRWELVLPGKGNYSPVVWGNTIFITSADDENYTGYVLAVDERDGKILWEKEYNLTDLKMHENNKLAAATPAVDASKVYIIWYSKEKTNLTALAHDGTLQWQAEFEGIESRHGG